MKATERPQELQRVVRVQSHGNFDEFTAFSPDHNQDVQVFVMDAPSPELLARATLLETLKHENLQKVFRAGAMADGRLGVMVEPSQGPTLAEVLKSHGPIFADDASQVLLALCRVLQNVHAAGLAHGRISLETVRFPGGLDAMRPRLEGLAFSVISGVQAAQSDDVYALGLLLVSMLNGAVTPADAPIPASAGALEAVIRRTRDPVQRPGTVVELARWLMGSGSTMVGLRNATPSHPEMLAVGHKLGPWEIQDLLGEGAMGQVFRARHSKLGRQTALKLLRPEQYAQTELIERFFQEARTVNEINHEHIVEIFDFTQEEGPDGRPTAVYCVMELLEGESLTARMAHAPLPLKRIRHIMHQVMQALAAAHKVGIVHRDVKGDNIYLVSRHGDDDYVKVLDFGVAKLTRKDAENMNVSTMDGAIIGTPSTMAPEQATGELVDLRVDVYAVGVILYELLSGKLPFDDNNFARLVIKLVKEPPPPLPDVSVAGEKIPEALKALVMKCLAKKREDRPASMAVLDVALTNALGNAASLAGTLPGTDAAVKAPSQRPAWILPVAVVVVLALIAVGVFFATRAPAVVVPPVAVIVPTPVEPVVPAPDAAVAVAIVEPPVHTEEIDAGPAVVAVAEVPDAGPVVKKFVPVAIPKKLDGAYIMEKMKTQRLPVRACLDRFIAELPQDKGTVVINVTIKLDGTLEDVHVIDAAALKPAIVDCLTRAASGMRFGVNLGPTRPTNLSFNYERK